MPMIMTVVWVVLFLSLQTGAHLLFKWGSASPRLFWWGICLGNALGILSTVILTRLYKIMPAALAVAIGIGGTFLLIQLVMFIVYREPLTPWALLGLALIFTGILLVAFLNTPPGS